MVVLVKLVDVQTASSLVHIDSCVHRTLDLNCLCSVSFLSVQFTSLSVDVHRLDRHQVSLHVMTVVSRGIVWSRNNCLTSRVEAKVSLVHQLLIERLIDCGVVICYCICVMHTLGIEFISSVLQQFVQD